MWASSLIPSNSGLRGLDKIAIFIIDIENSFGTGLDFN